MEKNSVTIVIPGKPIAQARPRLAKFGIYDPSAKAKKGFAKFTSLKAPNSFFEGALSADLEFHFPIPRSWPKKQRLKALCCDFYHLAKPDIDNLVKFVLDALNGVLYKDDSFVAKISAIKKYAEVPKTILTLREIHEQN